MWHIKKLVTDLVTPIIATDRDKTKLGINKGTLDGNLDFIGNLDTKNEKSVNLLGCRIAVSIGGGTHSEVLSAGSSETCRGSQRDL